MSEIIELPKPPQPPRMRGIRQAIEEVKKTDADSALTVTALRRLIKQGEIPTVRAGNKYLINLDSLFQYLSDGEKQPQAHTVRGGIRKIIE